MTITYEYRHLGKPNPVHRATEPATAPIGQEAPETAARLWDRIRKVEHDNNQAAARIRRLEAALEECLEYFDDRADIVDGDYGVNKPNREMVLAMMIKEAIGEGR